MFQDHSLQEDLSQYPEIQHEVFRDNILSQIAFLLLGFEESRIVEIQEKGKHQVNMLSQEIHTANINALYESTINA